MYPFCSLVLAKPKLNEPKLVLAKPELVLAEFCLG